ncbi:hypothetical protein PIIN_08345 [Serendipita indica DSM 11827]|uniref:Hypervirulence associated protein TUDOR domain-containing protein n=1 Tax=Serendipita indica (strain DSM 11827) TaxID=1109443 RepID=G4TSU6_SERID|nr:hypothetical protein PIIN_08345 [Serendipita indica DSM 11827]
MSRKAQQSETYEVGDRVECAFSCLTYPSSTNVHADYGIGGGTGGNEQSTTVGEICDILTERAPAGDTGVTVRASDENPRYVIKNDNTGKETAYKADNIIRKVN